MLNTIACDFDQARYDATFDAQKYLRQHGASLCDLIDALDDADGIDAFCDLNSAFGTAFPDAATIETAQREINRILEDQAPSSLDRLGRERNFYAADAARRHGDRVSELLTRFRIVG